MSTSEKIHVEGQASTLINAAAARVVALPPLPINGTWSINGQILAVDPAVGGTTHQVQFNIAASGISIAGTATETGLVGGAGANAWLTQPSGNPLTAAVVTLVRNAGISSGPPTAELEFTGSSVCALDWFWELDVIVATVP